MNEQANNETAAPEVINGIKMEQGRVYLRDKRNGTVYQYEDTLARMGFIEQFIHGEEMPEVQMGAVAVAASLDGQARAAAWDAEAMRNLKANEVTNVSEMPEPQSAPEKKYMPTEKAKGFDLKADFIDKGWTREQLVEEGYVVEVQ